MVKREILLTEYFMGFIGCFHCMPLCRTEANHTVVHISSLLSRYTYILRKP